MRGFRARVACAEQESRALSKSVPLVGKRGLGRRRAAHSGFVRSGRVRLGGDTPASTRRELRGRARRQSLQDVVHRESDSAGGLCAR